MLYVHENNFTTKIATNYHGKSLELQMFKTNYYDCFRKKISSIDFTNPMVNDFVIAAEYINEYYNELIHFIRVNKITSQSKLESTLLEELSVYLFKDIPEIKHRKLNFYNKGVFAGLKVNHDLSLDIIKKDVDFCIGRKINITIEEQNPIVITIPMVSVEVKTYLDATMFGEVKSSSKTLKSATPNSKAYILMGYKCLADEHILAARQDSTLDEMFVLRKGEGEPIDPYALYIYWSEVVSAIKNLTQRTALAVPGRLLAHNDIYNKIKEKHESE